MKHAHAKTQTRRLETSRHPARKVQYTKLDEWIQFGSFRIYFGTLSMVKYFHKVGGKVLPPDFSSHHPSQPVLAQHYTNWKQSYTTPVHSLRQSCLRHLSPWSRQPITRMCGEGRQTSTKRTGPAPSTTVSTEIITDYNYLRGQIPVGFSEQSCFLQKRVEGRCLVNSLEIAFSASNVCADASVLVHLKKVDPSPQTTGPIIR